MDWDDYRLRWLLAGMTDEWDDCWNRYYYKIDMTEIDMTGMATFLSSD